MAMFVFTEQVTNVTRAHYGDRRAVCYAKATVT